MALLDVSDVLDDPDFTDTFSVIRKVQTVSQGGIASDGDPTVFVDVSGVVQPATGRSLQRLDIGDRLSDAIKIYTRFGLTEGVGAGEADELLWHGGKYVVVNIRDYRRYGAGYIEATADLIEISPDGNEALPDNYVLAVPQSSAALTPYVGGGKIRFAEMPNSPPESMPAGVRTQLTFTVDTAQTQDFLNPPFKGNILFDGSVITPRAYADSLTIYVNLLVKSQVAGGQIKFDTDVGSPQGPTGSDTASLFNDAGVTERITGKLYLQSLNYAMQNGIRIFLTSSEPIYLLNEAIIIETQSTFGG